MQIDFGILDFIRNNISNPILDIVMPIITYIGTGGILWIAIALAMMISKKYRKTGFKLALALILELLVCNILLKNVVARTRPFDINTSIDIIIPKPTDFSFPSGHTTASFATAVVLMLSEKKRIWIPTLVLAVLIAFSRLYLYVHFPTDVLGGIILGTVLAFVSAKTVDLIYRKRNFD
jgi:undecaprenyl-diphosphatase